MHMFSDIIIYEEHIQKNIIIVFLLIYRRKIMVKKFSPSFQGAFHPSILEENEELSAGMKMMTIMIMMKYLERFSPN
jgi:hypothetical protein